MTHAFRSPSTTVRTVRGTCLASAVAGVLLLAAAPGPAVAATPSASSDGQALVEIVVTAQKREQALIDVPISISAYGRETLDLQGVRSVDDLTRLTPGLSNIALSTYGGETISIRGINSNTGASTTGIYIDDTPIQTRNYLGVVNNTYPLVFDLERVEVLRGPQGTLFGSGSEGGTVRFITPTPSLTQTSGYARADVGFTQGGRPSEEIGVAFGAPLVDDEVGGRISLWTRHAGGYIDRVSHDTGATLAKDTNSEDDVAFRGALKVAASEALTITPTLYYQSAHPQDLNLYWPQAGQYKSWYGIAQPDRDQFVLPALNVEYALPGATLKSITAYFDRKDDRIEDYAPLSIGALTGGAQSFVPGVDFHERSDTVTRQKNWSEELRLASGDDKASALSWVVGLFWQQSKQSYDQNEVDNIGDLLPVLFPGYDTASFYGRDQLPGNISFLEHLTYTTQEKAVFGEVGYRLTDKLKLTAGVRVSRSSFAFTDHQDGPFVGPVALDYAGAERETPVTPRVNLSYALDEGQVYATAAKGYRTGGANPQVPVTCAGDLATLNLTSVPATYKSDSVWSYEVGAKQRFLDHRLEVNTSVFWINWSDIQGNIPLLDCGFGYNTNLGKATSKGGDLQVQASPVRNLVITGSVGYTDATYSTTVLGPVALGASTGPILAKKGDTLGTPAWQASLSGEYSWAALAQGDAYVFASYQYTGDYHRTGSSEVYGYNSYIYDGKAIDVVALRAGLRRKGWDLSVYANNLLNTRTQTYFYQAQASGPDGARAETLRPRTIGITGTYRY